MAKSRILIIEDDAEVRELLSVLLSRAGFDIVLHCPRCILDLGAYGAGWFQFSRSALTL